MAPLCFYFAYRNSFVKDVLFNGWSPVIIAMAISSVGGFILDIGVKSYKVDLHKSLMNVYIVIDSKIYSKLISMFQL